ncbi:MAG: UDP binding domain-containing protein, partial [Bacteroidota bacterium]
VAQKVIKLLGKKGKLSNQSKVLILGFTFKENCPDTRNTRVVDIYEELKSYHLQVEIHDPQADVQQVKEEYGLDLTPTLQGDDYSAIILAVSHREFKALDWNTLRGNTAVIYDVKGFLDKKLVDARL